MNPASFCAAAPLAVLRFESLFNAGRALAFPCGEDGHVDVDALSERARANYFFARACVGREFQRPVVMQAAAAVAT